jgi:outer membrane protein assembly factor BamB
MNCLRLPLATLLSAILILTTSAEGEASTWPQWRGPNRDGQVSGSAWPDKLDTNHLREVWRVELGPSYSGPVVGTDRIFTTETKDKTFERVTAFDRSTGKELWRAQWEGALSVPFFAKSNGDWIRATPAFDGESLFVAGMRDVLVCLDAQTGKERWRFDFVQKLSAPLPNFGFVCSPLVDGEDVYVQAGASLVKISKRTGELVWRTLRDQGGMWGSVFSSPVFAELAGRRQLVVQTREKLAGVDAADGTVLWEQPVEAFRGMNILTPVAYNDTLFSSAYGGKTLGFKIAQSSDGKFTVNETWKHKAQGYMSTPVVIDGVAYTHLKSQRVMAIEIETGRELWTSDQSFGKYWSLVAQGNRILALDQRGQLFLLRANKDKFDLLDRRQLTDNETWAHLAVAGDQIFVRELHALSAFRWSRNSHLANGTRLTMPDINAQAGGDCDEIPMIVQQSTYPHPWPAEPLVRLEPAPTYKFPANPDCNSPCFWSEGRLHLFTSNQRPSRSSGPDLENLGQPEPCVFEDGAKKLRWIEAVHLRFDGILFGLYHREEYLGECPDREYFTVPDIGVARSTDQGRTWRDLGLVLQDSGVQRSCDTPNKFFAGGVGDPSWAIDPSQGFAYIFFSSYTDPVTNQGVQIARLALVDLESPVGKVWRWRDGRWDSPGLGGRGTPIVPARVAWSNPQADAFWGPSVHWNIFLEMHVVLVNHASDANWTQEGVYVFFARDLSKPDSFTSPRKIQAGGEWYAQVVGDPDIRGTDSLAGKSARFFQHGTSQFRIVFDKAPEPPKREPIR